MFPFPRGYVYFSTWQVAGCKCIHILYFSLLLLVVIKQQKQLISCCNHLFFGGLVSETTSVSHPVVKLCQNACHLHADAVYIIYTLLYQIVIFIFYHYFTVLSHAFVACSLVRSKNTCGETSLKY